MYNIWLHNSEPPKTHFRSVLNRILFKELERNSPNKLRCNYVNQWLQDLEAARPKAKFLHRNCWNDQSANP